MYFSRRKLLALLSTSALASYGLVRGLRYPPLSLSPEALPQVLQTNEVQVALSHCIAVSKFKFRAFSLEPSLRIRASETMTMIIEMDNLSEQAILSVDLPEGKVKETVLTSISRRVELSLKQGQRCSLTWLMPDKTNYRFAVIGDTGGGDELQWSLQRAKQLKADFVLHLGDFNYNEGEYDSAIENFKRSPLPCYICIGNHDFHDDGLIYKKFRQQLGPLNSYFVFAGVRFINLDTAADFFPASRGLRGKLLQQIHQDKSSYVDTVVFTHRPMKDVRAGEDHVIGGLGEMSWLKTQIKKLKVSAWLNGHVHKSGMLTLDGMDHYTVGEGLGYDDIINQQQVAKILVGEFSRAQKISYQWHDLNLPWHLHSNKNHLKWLQKDSPELLAWYKNKL